MSIIRAHPKHLDATKVRAWCLGHGWTAEENGDLMLNDARGTFRLTLGKYKARVHRRYLSSVDSQMRWNLVASGYYATLYIDPHNMLVGLQLRHL